MSDGRIALTYQQGTCVVEATPSAASSLPDSLAWDERTKQWRAEGCAYRDIVLTLHERGIPFDDHVRVYDKKQLRLTHTIEPREHQLEALKSWIDGGRRGVVQMPTGSGKTFLALLAMIKTGRPTLALVPTIDLLHQWHDVLSQHLEGPVGTLGGGTREIQDVTVATYDSAALHAEALGNRFGLLIADECHHLPAPQYRVTALTSIAPFRLGLSATVERQDGKEEDIYALMGPLVYEGRIDEMLSSVLSPYDVVSLEVPMTEEEAGAYQEARQTYTGFLRKHGIRFQSGSDWMEFVQKAARLPGGREAMKAYREQKRLAQASTTKLDELWKIIRDHPDDRILVFTDDNTLAYRIGEQFILPVLTHKTRPKERKDMLEAFRCGRFQILVTSKVLNEGVDVPEARIGVVVSGSGAVREHVQRLGRLLRHQPGKRALLYEIVSKGTSEYFVNRRRRQHHAYQRSAEV